MAFLSFSLFIFFHLEVIFFVRSRICLNWGLFFFLLGAIFFSTFNFFDITIGIFFLFFLCMVAVYLWSKIFRAKFYFKYSIFFISVIDWVRTGIFLVGPIMIGINMYFSVVIEYFFVCACYIKFIQISFFHFFLSYSFTFLPFK